MNTNTAGVPGCVFPAKAAVEPDQIIQLARKHLDQGLYHGTGHITRATDHELRLFANAVLQLADAKLETEAALHRATDAARCAAEAEVQALRKALHGLVRICDAMRLTAGLQGNQLTRLEDARALLLKE